MFNRYNTKNFWLFSGPMIILLALLTTIPIIYTFYLSFRGWVTVLPGSNVFVGLDNFIKLFQEPRFWNSVKTTIILTVIPISIQMILGFIIALFLWENRIGNNLFRSLLLIPMILPPIIVGLLWKIIFTPSLGGLDFILGYLGLPIPDWLGTVSGARLGLIIASVWEWTPFVMIMLLAGLESLPVEFFEAAKVDGAGWWKTLIHMTLPLLKKIFFITFLFRLVEALNILPLIYTITGGGPADGTETINFYALTEFSYYRIGFVSSINIIIFLYMMALGIYFAYATTKPSRLEGKKR